MTNSSGSFLLYMKDIALFSLYPLVPFVIALVLGMMTAHFFFSSVGVFVWCVFLCLSVLVSLPSFNHPVFQTWTLLASAFFFGCSAMCLSEQNSSVPLSGAVEDYEAVVAGEPVEHGKVVRFDAIITSGRLCGEKVRVSLFRDTVEGRYRGLTVNSGIRFRSRLTAPGSLAGKSSGKPSDSNFDYAMYLKVHGIAAQCFVWHEDWRPARVSLLDLSLFQRIALAGLYYRHKLIEAYRDVGLSGQVFAVTAAMTLGHKTDLTAETKGAYSSSGVSHTLALSGMHLSIIYIIISLFTLRRRPSLLRELFIIVSVWAYVFLVGMPLSVVRAAVMITVYSIVGLGGRDRMSLNVLAFTAIVMLIANPLSLYDAGFQLSFISVASIMLLYPPLASLFSERFRRSHPLLVRLWQMLSVSFCAQLGTAPLVAYYFGSLPVYSLLANVIAVPAVAAILYLSAAMLALFFVPAVRSAVASLLIFIVSSLNSALTAISSLPFASIGGIRLNTVQVFIAYALMLTAYLFLRILFTKADRWYSNIR